MVKWQGDVFSPWGFILAVEAVFRKCERLGGVSALGGWLERLEYADDAALLATGWEEAQERLTELAMVAREAADMEISKPKTEVMVVDSDGGVKAARPTAEDYAETSWKHVCECGRGFDCLDSLHKHAARFCPLNSAYMWLECCL